MKYVFLIALLTAGIGTTHAFADCTPTGTSCSACTTYRCASGYYGTATSGTSGCTICPSNATCAGGNGSIFVCAKGYYKDGGLCSRCPTSGGVYGTTAAAGATAVTECYLPANTPITDATGTYIFTGNCYYTE